MPNIDKTGPEGNGPDSGRKLGECSSMSNDEKLQKLGKGMGKRRKSGGGCGQGKRLKSSK